MKTPQRNFVVEFKSPRRQSKPSNSIWGDTDLKALAKEVENEHNTFASQTFTQDAIDNTTQFEPSNERPSKADVAVIAVEHVEDTSFALDVGAPPANELQTQETAPASGSQVVLDPKPREKLRRKAWKRTEHIEQSTIRIEPEKALTSRDEVAMLDAENRRLKLLLAQRIREENLTLHKMLERFPN